MGVRTFLAWQRLVKKRRLEAWNAQRRASWERDQAELKRREGVAS